jgi:hypothetical protein
MAFHVSQRHVAFWVPSTVTELWFSFRNRNTHLNKAEADLMRLAENSPHLMEDIGFRLDEDGHWTDGRTRLVPDDAGPSDLLLRAGRT